MADVVFIIGAGCSVHAGAPVMRGFLDRARHLLAANEVDDRRSEFEMAFEVISHLQRVHSKARLDHNNIEAVFGAVDLARTLGKLPGIAPDKIDDALRALVWLIVRTLEQSIYMETYGGVLQGTSEYRQLATLISELEGRTPRLTSAVLTFNYDVAMDFSFVAARRAFSYGLAEGEAGTPLLKLHGSLNWARMRNDTRAIVPYDLRTYANMYRVPWFDKDVNHPALAPITSQSMEQLRQSGALVENEPVLVPPTWSKGEYHRAISNVWRRAALELSEATYIFVLGYSLPETDQFFRLLFALGTEGKAVLSRVVVFDPTLEGVSTRFREMLGQGALDRFDTHRLPFGQGLTVIDQLLFETGKRRQR